MASRRPLVLAAANAALLAAFGAFVLRESGLATRPVDALAQLPHGQMMTFGWGPPTGSFEVPMEGGEIVWHGTYGNVVDNMIWYFGVYERAESLLSKELLAIHPGGYLDVGANFGNHALFLSTTATEVHAIEPWPPALERLQTNLAANPSKKVFIHPVGYGNEPGTLPFYPPPEGSFVVGSFDQAFAHGDEEVIDLPIVVADQHLVEVGAGKMGLVKVDIEGFERFALEGMRDTLVAQRPIVMFELNVTDGGFQSREALAATFPKNYEFWEVQLDPPWALNFGFAIWFYGSEATGHYQLRPLGDLRRLNAIAVPAEDVPAIQALAARG